MRNPNNRTVLALVAASVIFAIAGYSADYLGAEAVLQQVLATNVTAKTATEVLSPQQQLRMELMAFQTNVLSLPATEAAAQWLKFVDRFAQLPDDRANYVRPRSVGQEPLTPQDLITALPPPSAWQELVNQVDQRPAGEGGDALRQFGLRLLAHTLAGDAAHRHDDVAALQNFAAKAKGNQMNRLYSLFQQLQRSLMAQLDNPDAIIGTLNQQLATQQSDNNWGDRNLEVPDLVALVGAEKAEAFLRKALVQWNGNVAVPAGTATQKLAQKLALELVGQLKKAQWPLVNSLEATELYEAMDKRFSAPASTTPTNEPSAIPMLPTGMANPDDYEKQNAQIYYFLGLIAKGAVTNAVAVAKEFEHDANLYFPDEVIRQMERAGFTSQLNDFLHEQLSQNPELPLWDEYVTVAAHAGQTTEMVKLVRSTVAQGNLSKGQRFRLHRTLCNALLADDQVEAGVKELHQLLEETNAMSVSAQLMAQEDRGALALQIARIGHLLNNTNWLEDGITLAKSSLQSADEANSYWGKQTSLELAVFLRDIGHGPEAEQVLANRLAEETKKSRGNRAAEFQMQQVGPQYLCELVRLYHEAGKPEDVLKIFDQAPFWGAEDLAQLPAQLTLFESSSSDYYNKHVTAPAGFYAAAALIATGHPVEARKILDALFDQSPGCDRLYELLLKLDDEQAPAALDALFARDQFEERPLIWKAHWLRMHQQLEAAEQTARKAISIDPTDGEEGPGDRLRAYAELAEIRAARGDEKEAQTLRGAVAAVHEAELADQFHAAGLLKHAIDLYTDSLNKFADAYCIHARLAVQLSDMGKHEEAAEHYRRAYELMPDSFGRVESHCFGCERAFDGERAQSIAEQVFIELAQKTPNKPQVHYMLGYLRDEQSRYQEALESYRKAVKLDPDYLNAWVRMEGACEHVILTPTERDTIIFNILRLDPMHHRETPSFELVSDLKTLWNQIADNEKKQPVMPVSLYPLSASAAELEKHSKDSNQAQNFEDLPSRYSRGNGNPVTSATAISQNGYVQAALDLLRNDVGGDE